MIEPKPGTLAEPEMHARLVEELGVFEDGELTIIRRSILWARYIFSCDARGDAKQSKNRPLFALRALPNARTEPT